MTRASFVAALACLLLAGCTMGHYFAERTIDGKPYQCHYRWSGSDHELVECVPLKAFVREKPRECGCE